MDASAPVLQVELPTEETYYSFVCTGVVLFCIFLEKIFNYVRFFIIFLLGYRPHNETREIGVTSPTNDLKSSSFGALNL